MSNNINHEIDTQQLINLILRFNDSLMTAGITFGRQALFDNIDFDQINISYQIAITNEIIEYIKALNELKNPRISIKRKFEEAFGGPEEVVNKKIKQY